MGRFNGAKTAQKRERNQKKLAEKVRAGSSLKSTAAAMTIKCAICQTAFLGNSGWKALQPHIDSKHPKSTRAECFPEHTHLWDEADQ